MLEFCLVLFAYVVVGVCGGLGCYVSGLVGWFVCVTGVVACDWCGDWFVVVFD